MNIFIYIILGIIVIAIAWMIGVYNGLIKSRNRVDEAWSDIDVQLKRRYDLIPNLMETVKGYAKHEKELFENVTKARSEAMNAQGLELYQCHFIRKILIALSRKQGGKQRFT